MKRLLTVALLLVLIIVPLMAAPLTIKLAHLNPQEPFDVPSAAMAAAFKSEVEANSNGQILVEIYPNGVLGKERETMLQVKSGIVHSFISSSGGLSTFYPLIDVTNLPFAFSSYNVGYEVYDGDFGLDLAADIERQAGFKVLGFGESGGFFAITNSKREIRTPADMKGLKLRVMAVPLHQEVVKSLGASPTVVAWAEVYTSLQTGVVDGQMNPISIINMAKFYEVQDYITLTNHLYAPYVWVMNPRFYNGLTVDQKKIIDDASRTAVLAGRGVSRVIDSSDKGLPVLLEKMNVYVPTAAEMKQFRDLAIPAARAFLEKSYKNQGKYWVDRFLAAVEAAEKKLGY
ncbi:MAG TPA: C4-dicarboxylate ABC transporter substrate-binding protein [Sphaerochaeta sp.]|nr:MAG: C4-dicarboxylate ABC transporter substrate-binding protein [Spirochaetes bacterium GWC2_52_13]OHD62797.1 MAG: C4-dicarboxylate ABC transporter substrate-binding protein [Spirochaetes bacterium GWF2_52_7]PKL11420.1 MAG: C4-dicarboxylate ABC transporter substrate-binding protein [Spirochaetae bacterium HGW-Spirochaetae-8]PKL19727.1 MAG: C4-dicarboxylate ABC transporter substrate-binding protein [Spirochaetae bacterium HGW-Spirochaetae-4]HCG63875.1 C4-dicarboxylate ABC transporter substrat